MPCLTQKYQSSILAANPGAGSRRWDTPGPAHPKILQASSRAARMVFLVDIHCQSIMWWAMVSLWWKRHRGRVGLRWPSLAETWTPHHPGQGEKFLVDVALGRVPGPCPQLGAAAAAAGDEARISTGTEKLQREVSGAKSWLGTALGSPEQRSLSASLIPGVCRGAGLQSFTWPTPSPAPVPGRHSSSHQPNWERKEECRGKTRSAKPRILESCFSQKKKKVCKPLWLQQKPLLEPWASSDPGRFLQDQFWGGLGWCSSHTSGPVPGKELCQF